MIGIKKMGISKIKYAIADNIIKIMQERSNHSEIPHLLFFSLFMKIRIILKYIVQK